MRILFTFILSVSLHLEARRDFLPEYKLARELILQKCKLGCKLNELHRSVLQGDTSKIRQLVKDGIDINTTANQKWTATHFAALYEDRSILDLLYTLGANKNKLDANKGTAEDLWRLTHLQDDLKINFWDENNSSVVQISSDEFEKIMGARFVESTKMSPLTLVKEWLNGFKQPKAHANGYIESIEPTTRQDGVYIKKMPGNIGYGIYALRQFEPGEVIGEYQGEWTGVLNREDSEYSTQVINGRHLRGYIPFSAHGFPNAVLTESKPVSGISANELLVATTSIEPHQPVMWNYGTHDVVWQSYAEQLSEVLDAYLLKNSLNSEDVTENSLNIIAYILTTPTVLIRLIFEGKLSTADAFGKRFNLIVSRFGVHGSHLLLLANAIKSTLKHTQKMVYASRQSIHEFLAEKARDGNVQVLTSFLLNIANLCKDNTICTRSQIENFWLGIWSSYCSRPNMLYGPANCSGLRSLLESKQIKDLKEDL